MEPRPDIPDSGTSIALFLERERYHDASAHAHAEYRSMCRYLLSEFYLGLTSVFLATLLFFFMAGILLQGSPLSWSVGVYAVYGVSAVSVVLGLKSRISAALREEDERYKATLSNEGAIHLTFLAAE